MYIILSRTKQMIPMLLISGGGGDEKQLKVNKRGRTGYHKR